LLVSDKKNKTEIAEIFRIPPADFDALLIKYPELKEALDGGKEYVKSKIESALLKRAMGYRYIEIYYRRCEETGSRIADKWVTKQKEPDLNAIKYWLAHRVPAEWGLTEKEAQKVKEDAVKIFLEQIERIK